MEPCKTVYKEKIGIIGAGPAGLSAAVDLVRLGYPVTVFEAKHEPGGMLRYAIPTYRLPDRTVKREIDWIKGLGVKILTGKKIEDPKTLLKKGFSAVLVATGAPKSVPLGIQGENSEGVIDALEFLGAISAGHPMELKGEIITIGGGSTAFDVARSMVRLGAKKVTLAYRRSVKEMPAETEEIKDAKEEGVKIITLTIPKKIITKNNKVTGVEFLKAKLGSPDKSGRRKPIPISGSEFVVNADFVIPAVGTRPNVKNKVFTNEKGRVIVNNNMITKVKGVFAAGDAETGSSSVVEAIGRGHQAANGIHSYLRKTTPANEELCCVPIVVEKPKYTRSTHAPKRLSKKNRIKSFNEVEQTIIGFQAVEEASRCFTCGPCYLCAICLPNCSHKQIACETNENTFLLKVPCNLSSKVTKKATSSAEITSNKKTKKVKLHSLTPTVNKDLCIGCGRCEEVCSYRAISNIITKNEKTIAEVDHDACVSCSACVSVCPTGAISQGYMSDEDILKRLQETNTSYKGVKGLISFWNTKTPVFNAYNGFIDIMSDRKPSPSFLVKALARSGRGLLVVGPDGKSGKHYLPPEENPENVVKKAQELLKLVGISPDRIQYKKLNDTTCSSGLLKDYSQYLDKKQLKDLNVPTPGISMSPLGESMALLGIMWANSDTKSLDESFNLPSAKKGEPVFFEGCIPMLHKIGETHKLFDLKPARHAIYKLLEITGIKCGSIPDLSCPAKGLLHVKIDNAGDIVKKIAEKNLKAYNRVKPKKLIISTPEAFSTFSAQKEYKKVAALPEEIYNKLKSKKFYPIKKTIAIHPTCSKENDPFYTSTKKLLRLIPGIKIIELEGKCHHNGFDNIDSSSKESAVKLLKKAEKKDADIIVCISPYCESFLLLCQRQGSWCSTDICISDVYQLLLCSLEGGDI